MQGNYSLARNLYQDTGTWFNRYAPISEFEQVSFKIGYLRRVILVDKLFSHRVCTPNVSKRARANKYELHRVQQTSRLLTQLCTHWL